MDIHDEKAGQPLAASQKRYETPCIEWEQELDIRTLSIACGKQDPFGNPACASGIGS